uniref:Uncharacterized protein n=1 Tax=Palpitomonas bilix TaxID=652834 RepID=A0A7S3CWQ7_9EUKA|mmetsp:Transcript_12444/g.33302  ORF Transcript_12444/g.33302 Transcript_12444/m.33302 type:complete len:139 (+) Transcript_12444:186-602(+)
MAKRKAANYLREVVSTKDAPAAIGAYSQAIRASGDFLFVSGQIPLDPTTMAMVEGGVVEQAEQVMKNLSAVLSAGGASFKSVVKATVLLADINDFQAVNEVYAKYFDEGKPARAAFQAAGLPKGALVEIEAIALVEEK